MTAAIVGLATWLPEHIRGNDAWPADFGVKAANAVESRTFNDIPLTDDPISASIVARDLALEAEDPFLGAKFRHVADPGMSSITAEVLAAKDALADAGISPLDVDIVLSNAIVNERIVPVNAPGVAYGAGCTNAVAIGIETACASSVVGLTMARAYIEAGIAKTVLITQSHLFLRAMPFLHPAVPGLGDGAAAMVVTKSDTHGLALAGDFARTHGENFQAVTWVRGTSEETDNPWWEAGTALRLGSRNTAQLKGLMRDTVSFGASTVRSAAENARIDVERIGVLASVQPRGFFPHAIAERLGLARDVAVTTYERVGHLGTCGPVFNLAEARARGRLTSGTVVALYGQGAGFSRAAMILHTR